MKTVDYPCEHGYYGLCTQCVREERNELRARVAELEARIAELQPMAECATIMAVCGYFSRMRGPDAWLDHGSWDEYPELFACAGVDLRSFQHGTRFYADSAPVPAAQDFSLMQGGYCCECGHELCDTCAPLHTIMPAPAAQMDNPDVMARATKYARDIVTWLHRDHYADSTAFEPFDDLLGLLSQIDNMICGWKEHPAAQAEAKVADGWVLVPREPTEEMVIAALKEVDPLRELIDWTDGHGFMREDARRAWSAMLAAKAKGGGA